jgi:squalene-hopene/tetraprenyl-beta-curcumene cyclase
MTLSADALAAALAAARRRLLAERTAAGHWEGRLSDSALSTATATWALHMAAHDAGRDDLRPLVRGGLGWLAANQNADGGWGDTPRSHSNISTTLLAWSALAASDGDDAHARAAARAEDWLRAAAGGLEPAAIARAIDARYGRDRTFSVPILMTCALAGRLGDERDAWRFVRPLPFELAALPHTWWNRVRLPVVSYALPALVAIGQARYAQRPPRFPLTRAVRALVRRRTLAVVESMQPESGGFLEATPLTSFVTMGLLAAGQAEHPAVARAVAFLAGSVRADGAWPIDTNLATWTTTLATAALAAGPDFDAALPPQERRGIVDWLLAQQHRAQHPFTRAAPGGWAWTDLSGGVPDADDTAGALIALRHLAGGDARLRQAASEGLRWLLDLQNRDGGIPTFCRGWGALPFDRSAADLTAHALAAWTAWRGVPAPPLAARMTRAIDAALAFLRKHQRADGAWLPLWFGNQDAPDEANPAYGTARVLTALASSAACGTPMDEGVVRRAARWLLEAQHSGGGWGGAPGVAPSIEETALAVEALSHALATPPMARTLPADDVRQAVARGAAHLVEQTAGGETFEAAPIGFYFARLWYSERLYPIVFTVAALGRASRVMPTGA